MKIAFSLKRTVTQLENAIITLSGPAIAISGIIAGIDLLTGGSMFKNIGWLSLTWAICLLLTLDFQVLALGVRAQQIYTSAKSGRRKFCEILVVVFIAAAISYVSVQMQSIIARSQDTITTTDSRGQQHTTTISIDQATRDMGINPIALIWERSSLVLILIFMSGWLRDEDNGSREEGAEERDTKAGQETSNGTGQLHLDYGQLAKEVAPLLQPHISAIRTTIIEELRATNGTGHPQFQENVALLAGTTERQLPPPAGTRNETHAKQTRTRDTGTGGGDNANRIAQYQAGHPEASRQDIAAALGISTKTVSRYWKAGQEEGTGTLPETNPHLVATRQ